MPSTSRNPHARARAGFSIPELLVTIAIIVVLLGLLFPVLRGVWSTGSMTKSMNNQRQIALWMREYADDNNDRVLPSSFDYTADPFLARVKVRSNPNPTVGTQYAGSWADILQTVFEVSVYPQAGAPISDGGLENDFRYDAPDKPLYDLLGEGAIDNPFRSAARNTRNAFTIDEATPYGDGADEKDYPGFFAANDLFATEHTNGEIRFPDRLIYLVDAFIGETVDPAISFDEDELAADFRYGGDEICLMLFLDGHIDPVPRWGTEAELLERGIRIINEP